MHLVSVIRRWMITTFSLVHLAVSPEIRDNREVSPTAFDVACKRCQLLVMIGKVHIKGLKTYAFLRYGYTCVFEVSLVA